MAEPEQEAWAAEADAGGEPEAAVELDPGAWQAILHGVRTERDQQKEQADQYLTMLQRVQADFVNYKRRVEAEQQSKAEAVRADTIRAFLPLVDDLERALAHFPAALAAESWAQGFGLIERNLGATFDRLGVKKVGAVGEPFDPNVHEAVAYEEHPTQPEGHVANVLRPGYRLGERIVRPAQVSVARAPAEPRSPEQPAWPRHEPRRAHGNGGASEADLRRPRGIDRI